MPLMEPEFSKFKTEIAKLKTKIEEFQNKTIKYNENMCNLELHMESIEEENDDLRFKIKQITIENNELQQQYIRQKKRFKIQDNIINIQNDKMKEIQTDIYKIKLQLDIQTIRKDIKNYKECIYNIIHHYKDIGINVKSLEKCKYTTCAFIETHTYTPVNTMIENNNNIYFDINMNNNVDNQNEYLKRVFFILLKLQELDNNDNDTVKIEIEKIFGYDNIELLMAFLQKITLNIELSKDDLYKYNEEWNE